MYLKDSEVKKWPVMDTTTTSSLFFFQNIGEIAFEKVMFDIMTVRPSFTSRQLVNEFLMLM